MSTITRKLIADDTLEKAYAWLCHRRKDYPDSADIWIFRKHWLEEKLTIQQSIASGQYQFGLLSRVNLKEQGDVDLWSAKDALVLKALSLVLADAITIPQNCYLTKGHGGVKGAVRNIHQSLGDYKFVFKTDVKSYYASIDHVYVMDQLAEVIEDRIVLNLV